MERVSFLSPDGIHVACLMNPEEIVITRTAGTTVQKTAGASLTRQNDPVQRLSGGTTRLVLKLLFDATLSNATSLPGDVRALTEPLWKLSAESGRHFDYSRKIRFMWGKNWNIPGDIESISERLEQFTGQGAPQRAWLTVSFVAAIDVLYNH